MPAIQFVEYRRIREMRTVAAHAHPLFLVGHLLGGIADEDLLAANKKRRDALPLGRDHVQAERILTLR